MSDKSTNTFLEIYKGSLGCIGAILAACITGIVTLVSVLVSQHALPSIATASTTSTTPPRVLATATPALPDTTLIFQDQFDPCLLPEEKDNTHEFKCENGSYKMSGATSTAWWVNYDRSFTDSVVQVNASGLCQNAFVEYGLLFRMSKDAESFYGVSLTNEGKYSIFLYQNDQFTDLIPFTDSTAIKIDCSSGNPPENQIRVVVQGIQFAVYVNDQWLNTLSDSRLRSGTVGLFFNPTQARASAYFSNLQIWQINRSLQLPIGTPTIAR